jgi:hypothetical protein
LLLVGRAGVRSWNERSPCCHLLLLSVQYMATLDGRRGLSNSSGDLVYPIRPPPPQISALRRRKCASHQCSSRMHQSGNVERHRWRKHSTRRVVGDPDQLLDHHGME